jgi:DNA polymerase-1
MVNNGRLSSNVPNLQQIPRDNCYRHCFYDELGITVCDYSSMEVRRVAECANEKYLIDALNAGLDPHLETAKKLFNLEGLSESEIAKKRTIAKTLNFSIIYGVSAWKLANDYNVPQKEAQQWIDNYFKMYPNIALYLKKVRALAIKNGYIVIDKYGRRAYFSEWGRLQALRAEISRQEAIGFPPEKSLLIEANKLQGDIERAAGNYVISGEQNCPN